MVSDLPQDAGQPWAQTAHVVAKRRELVSVASSMLASEKSLIEGVRQICALRFEIEDPENEAFLAARGIDSETDAFPLGPMRATCSPEYLERMDREMQSYLSEARADILAVCREIVATFA